MLNADLATAPSSTILAAAMRRRTMTSGDTLARSINSSWVILWLGQRSSQSYATFGGNACSLLLKFSPHAKQVRSRRRSSRVNGFHDLRTLL
jgi:hypothetical protein